MRKLTILCLVLGLAALASAQTTSISNSATATGTIAATYTFGSGHTWGDMSTHFGSITSTHYAQGYYDVPDLLTGATVSSNAAIEVSASVAWTLPGTYPASATKAQFVTNGSGASDVFMSVASVSLSDLVIQGSYGTAPGSELQAVGITSGAEVILASTGPVAAEEFNAAARIMLDYDEDIPGEYTMTVTLTIAEP